MVLGFMFALTVESNAQCSKDKTAAACTDSKSTASSCCSKSGAVASLVQVGVSGKEGVCKVKVETAAKSVNGVKEATWDSEKQLLSLNLTKDAKLSDVEKAVVDAGYEVKVLASKE